MLAYKGYSGHLEIDDEAGFLFGRILDINDVVTFKGNTVEEAKQAFKRVFEKSKRNAPKPLICL